MPGRNTEALESGGQSGREPEEPCKGRQGVGAALKSEPSQNIHCLHFLGNWGYSEGGFGHLVGDQ